MDKIFCKSIAVVIAFTCLTACTRTLKQEIDSRAADKEISQEDIKELTLFIKSNHKYAKYEQPAELYKYILKVVSSYKDVVTVWEPMHQGTTSAYNVNVYLENSYSMDGYMTAANGLKSDVYELLNHLHQHTEHLSLNYISEKTVSAYPDANKEDNRNFILNLNSKTFRAIAGNRGISDMSNIIGRVLEKTNNKNVSVIISDFVFSPGSGVNAADYLRMEQSEIEGIIKDKLGNQKDLSIAVYQMNAPFKGYYFDHNNATIPTPNIIRPYYIWIIGGEKQVGQLLTEQAIDESNLNFSNKVVFKSTKTQEPLDFKIVFNDKIGDFAKTGQKNEISNAVDKDGKFAFSVALNLGNNIRGLDYFLEQEHYLLNDADYAVSSRLLNNQEKAQTDLTGYTHLLTFKTSHLANRTITLKIISEVPAWISNTNSNDDSTILSDRAEQGKTFGLNYLINGVYRGFSITPNPSSNVISTLKININKI